MGEALLTTAQRELAYTPARLRDGSPTNYGFGLRIEEVRGLRVVHHTGITTGFRTFVRRIPEIGLCTTVLSNAAVDGPKELAPAVESLAIAAIGQRGGN
jgi:CubicO group peptidase (beta-lactamase class C family)